MGADEAVADHVQRLQVVAGVDVLLFQAGLVLRDDVKEKVFQTRSMQVIGDPMRALERGREIVEAIHRFLLSRRRLVGELHVAVDVERNARTT